jgi:hypothetical protein
MKYLFHINDGKTQTMKYLFHSNKRKTNHKLVYNYPLTILQNKYFVEINVINKPKRLKL